MHYKKRTSFQLYLFGNRILVYKKKKLLMGLYMTTVNSSVRKILLFSWVIYKWNLMKVYEKFKNCLFYSIVSKVL